MQDMGQFMSQLLRLQLAANGAERMHMADLEAAQKDQLNGGEASHEHGHVQGVGPGPVVDQAVPGAGPGPPGPGPGPSPNAPWQAAALCAGQPSVPVVANGALMVHRPPAPLPRLMGAPLQGAGSLLPKSVPAALPGNAPSTGPCTGFGSRGVVSVQMPSSRAAVQHKPAARQCHGGGAQTASAEGAPIPVDGRPGSGPEGVSVVPRDSAEAAPSQAALPPASARPSSTGPGSTDQEGGLSGNQASAAAEGLLSAGLAAPPGQLPDAAVEHGAGPPAPLGPPAPPGPVRPAPSPPDVKPPASPPPPLAEETAHAPAGGEKAKDEQELGPVELGPAE